MDYTQLAIGGVALIPLIIGIVEFTKRMGNKGRGLEICALSCGIVAGAAWGMIQQGLVPEIALPWIRVVFIALGVGVASSVAAMGNYDLIKKFFGPKSD
jgi:large-conductance mechanosensitive channel